MKTIHIIVSILGILGLSACDPALDHKKVIVNASDVDIAFRTVNHFQGMAGWSKPDSIYSIDSIGWIEAFSIPSKTERIIFDSRNIGVVSEISSCLVEADYCGFDSITCQVTKDIQNEENWERVIEEEYSSGGGIVNCYFMVTHEDIKKE